MKENLLIFEWEDRIKQEMCQHIQQYCRATHREKDVKPILFVSHPSDLHEQSQIDRAITHLIKQGVLEKGTLCECGGWVLSDSLLQGSATCPSCQTSHMRNTDSIEQLRATSAYVDYLIDKYTQGVTTKQLVLLVQAEGWLPAPLTVAEQQTIIALIHEQGTATLQIGEQSIVIYGLVTLGPNSPYGVHLLPKTVPQS